MMFSTKGIQKLTGAVFIWLMGSTMAHATNLLQVYQQALQADPTLSQAKALAAANQEYIPQSRAALLPNLSAQANSTAVRSSPERSTFGNTSNTINQHDYSLTLTQPLFNVKDWMSLQAAHAQAAQGEAQYQAALQALMIRVANAYFNVLEAEDLLQYTQAEKTATANQLKQIKEKYQVGLATMTDVYQAQAAYDQLVAATISGQNDVANAQQALQQITGVNYTYLNPLQKNLPLLKPYPAMLSPWLQSAEKYNWSLLAERDAAQSAKAIVHENFAGHLPTVEAIGSYQKGNDLGLGNPGAETQSESQIGVQVNLPIFQGGLVNAQTRQAQDQYVAANDQMEITHRQVIFDTQQAFNNVVAGISKIEADRVAVTSAQSALDSTHAGYQAGTKTILDVLTAIQNLYQAKATLATDQYAYLNNTLLLKQSAGTLNATDVAAINRWLTPQ